MKCFFICPFFPFCILSVLNMETMLQANANVSTTVLALFVTQLCRGYWMMYLDAMNSDRVNLDKEVKIEGRREERTGQCIDTSNRYLFMPCQMRSVFPELYAHKYVLSTSCWQFTIGGNKAGRTLLALLGWNGGVIPTLETFVPSPPPPPPLRWLNWSWGDKGVHKRGFINWRHLSEPDSLSACCLGRYPGVCDDWMAFIHMLRGHIYDSIKRNGNLSAIRRSWKEKFSNDFRIVWKLLTPPEMISPEKLSGFPRTVLL